VPGSRGHVRADRMAVYGGSALGDAAPGSLSVALRVHGPVVAFGGSDAAGAVALGEALHLIRAGRVDAVLAGGAEAPLNSLTFGAFDSSEALGAGHNDRPAAASRPFDSARDGFILGEGAAFMVLEEASIAERRGARPYAELRGYAATSDGHHPTDPAPDGRQAARAARLALADGRLRAAEVDYVNAHAASTQLGDIAEARALRLALSVRGAVVPVAGTKGWYGHPLGASGAIEAAICALAIERGWAPGTLNLEDPDPQVLEQLPVVTKAPVQGPFRGILSTSFGSGGLNAALAFSAFR
jgi:3-oxoacyl-[acyl-carrier-protein] synthase II